MFQQSALLEISSVKFRRAEGFCPMGAGLDKLSNVSSQNHLQDLSGYALKEAIQTKNSRFLKPLECICEEGRVLVKIYGRRGESLETLQREKAKLESISSTFNMVKNSSLIPFKVILTERAAFLVRQYFAHNLCERLGTRPFLSALEKRWILFQLLKALDQCHHWGISHGGVTTENVLLTTWGRAYLADFSPFKPAYLPLEDPSDFTFFYNSSGRTAYIAPERFYSTADSGVRTDYVGCSDLPPSADVFSFGCVAAELFLPSERPLFDFAQLLAFRKGEYQVEDVVKSIEDPFIRDLVLKCTYLDPAKRISISACLAEWPDKSFHHLYAYYNARLCGADPDQRVARISKDFDEVYRLVQNPDDLFVEAQLPSTIPKQLQKSLDTKRRSISVKANKPVVSVLPLPAGAAIGVLAEAHLLMEGASQSSGSLPRAVKKKEEPPVQAVAAQTPVQSSPSPPPSPPSFLPGSDDRFDSAPSTPAPSTALCEPMIVILAIVLSSIRHVHTPSSKVQALKLLVRFAKVLDDDVRLGRIVPFVFAVLPHSEDKPLVRASVIRTLEQVLALVSKGEPAVFQAYILPGISHFSRDVDETVREMLAACLASLTTTARRLAEGALTPELGFDGVLHELRKLFHAIVRDLLEDNSMAVKRRILMSLTPLCLFFGRRVATETFVPFVLTFLSHPQWQLRVAAYHHLLGVVSIVGAKSLEDIVMALISKSFSDPEESVIDRSLLCVVSLVQAGLLRRKVVLDLAALAAPLLLHPSRWIQSAALQLLEVVWDSLTAADRFVLFLPAVSPFLVRSLSPTDASSALRPLIKPAVTRQELQVALAVAHEMYRKGMKVDSQGFAAQLLARLKQNKVSDASLSRLLLLAHWMQSHAEGNLAKMQEAEAADLGDAQKFTLVSGGDRVGTIEKPIVLPNVNVVTIDRRSLLDDDAFGAGSQRFTDEEWNAKFAHISLKQSNAGGSLSISLSAALDPNATITPTGEPTGPALALSGSSFFGDGGNNNNASASPASPAGTAVSAVASAAEPAAVHLNLSVGEHQDDFAAHGASAGLNPDGGLNSSSASASNLSGAVNASSLFVAYANRLNQWKPKGTLVAHLHEHSAAVSQIAVSDDQRFFVTGSLDGTVKVWDCERLHTIVTNRSRLTCKLQKGQINSVATIRNTHSVASACNLGTVHVFNIEHQRKVEKSFSKTIYTGIQTVRFIDRSEGSIFDVRNFEGTPSSSVLMYATSMGNIHGWDLRMKTTSEESFVMRNSPRLGFLTSISVDNSNNWVMVGTDLGIYTIWDLRFQIPVRSFAHPSDSGAVSLSAAPRHAVFASNLNSTVTHWDVEAGIAKCVLRMSKPRLKQDQLPPPPIVNISAFQNLRIVPSEGTLGSIEPDMLKEPNSSLTNSSLFSSRPQSTTVDLSFKSSESMSDLTDLNFVGLDAQKEPNAVRAMLSPPEGGWLITGSTDCKLRFWDLKNASESYTFSGLGKQHKATYWTEMQEGIQVINESVEISSVRAGPNGGGVVAASTAHRDAVCDLAVVHASGAPMVVSGDRAGVIKVFL